VAGDTPRDSLFEIERPHHLHTPGFLVGTHPIQHHVTGASTPRTEIRLGARTRELLPQVQATLGACRRQGPCKADHGRHAIRSPTLPWT
jgi:hypothetical protein